MTVEINAIPLGLCRSFALKGDGVVVIDAGQPRKGRRFESGLEAAGISPGEVRLIVLTHGHWDHVGSARDIRSITGALGAIHRRDAPGLSIFAMDEEEMVRSWTVLIERGAKTVYPAHGDPFPISHVIGEIERRN